MRGGTARARSISARIRRFVVVALAGAFTLLPCARAQPQAQPDQPLWRLFAKEQELVDLIDACSKLLGQPIECGSGEVSGTVRLDISEPMSADALWDLASRALVERGLTTVQAPGSNALTVVALDKAGAMARLEKGSLLHAHAGFVKVLIELTLNQTEAVADAIKLVLSKQGSATVFKDTRSILVSDLRPHALQAASLAARFDGRFEELHVEDVRLSHAGPTALVALIERISNARKLVFGDKYRGTLLAHPETGSVLIIAPAVELDVWRELVTRFDQTEPVRTQHYMPRRFGLAETAKLVEASVKQSGEAVGSDRWRMVTDNLSGSLIVTATPSQHREIEELLDRLEMTAGEARKPVRSFAIKNRGVEEMYELLQGLLDAGVLKPETPKPTTPAQPVQGATAPIPATAPPPISGEKLGGEVVLTIDKPTNRLIAMGEGRMLEQLGALIEELDVRHPQVIIEALVVGLTENQTLSLGVELQKLGEENDVLYRLSNLFGLGSPDPALSQLPAPGGAGLSGVVLDPGDFSAIVRAMETVNHGRTLTMPKVLVNNNQPAELNSVLQTPFASTNASTTVATTTFGGTQDAGTQISVTPQIADGDQLVLDYTISISAFVGSPPSPELPPPRQENKLKSIVTIPDGYTVAVGGLEIGTESDVSSHVPLLGRIPILGALFANQTATDNKSRFFVFLRATVLRDDNFDDLKHLTVQDLADAKVDDGWPVLEPRVIR
jgi:type II secretory pathway component GspD/PulD (secretin)